MEGKHWKGNMKREHGEGNMKGEHGKGKRPLDQCLPSKKAG